LTTARLLGSTDFSTTEDRLHSEQVQSENVPENSTESKNANTAGDEGEGDGRGDGRPDLTWPDFLFSEMKPQEAFPVYSQMIRYDLTGWAIFRAAEIVYNENSDNYGSKNDEAAKAPELFEEAAELFRQSVNNHPEDVRYKYGLGKIYLKGLGVKKKEREGLRLLKLAAKGGYPFAQVVLGEYHLNKKPKAALKFFKLAAKQGSPRAQFNIAAMFSRKDEKSGEPFVSPEEAFEMAILAYSKSYCFAEQKIREIFENLRDTQLDLAVKLLKRAADRGVPYASRELSLRCAVGQGVPLDKAESAKYKKILVAQGDLDAQVQLAVDHLQGAGVEKNAEEAKKLLFGASEKGHPVAHLILGEMYETHPSVEKDLAKAVEYYEKSAAGNCPQGFYHLGRVFWTGTGVPADRAKGLDLFKKAAEGDDSASQFMLGQIYLSGESGICEQNHHTAAEYFKRASEKGHGEAAFKLGEMYKWGAGVTQNNFEAEKYFMRAGELGHVPALLEYGVMAQEDGRTEEAGRAFWAAAEAGSGPAHVYIASQYYNGSMGFSEDREAAVRHLKKATELECAEGMAYLAVMYRRGDGGVPVDPAKAEELADRATEMEPWMVAQVAESYRVSEDLQEKIPDRLEQALWLYLKAAKKGSYEAMQALSEMYGNGEGVKADEKESKRWFGLAQVKAAEEGRVETEGEDTDLNEEGDDAQDKKILKENSEKE
jgi:TPR repeat protein